MLTKEQTHLLERMKNDLGRAKNSFYKPSDFFWKRIVDDFERRRFRNEGIGEIQSQSYNTLFAFLSGHKSSLTGHDNIDFEICLWTLYMLLKSRDKHGLLDKTEALIATDGSLYLDTDRVLGRPNHLEKKRLTWDYLFSMDTVLRIVEHYPEILTEELSICEVGAGWGRLSYYFTQVNNKLRYHIFDIPHVLLISHEYLARSTKHIKVFSYDTSNVSNNEPGIRFFTSNRLEDLDGKTFDLFINQASFQEMTLDQVVGYFERINTLSKRFYSFQRYECLDMEYKRYPIYTNWTKTYDADCCFDPLWFEQFFVIN
jgi:putative sugar O-methyltransferase